MDELSEILAILAQRPRAKDLARRIDLCSRGLSLVSQTTQLQIWISLKSELANILLQSQGDNRANNIEQAVDHYQQVLDAGIRHAHPEQWAATNNNLAAAYRNRISGERIGNIEKAIHHLLQALEVYSREIYPEQWAMTQHNLGIVFSKRIRGERAENIEQAIYHFQLALEIRDREHYPKQWAITESNLAIVFLDRIQGERAENLEQAIKRFQLAQEISTQNTYPQDWAMIQNGLGNSYNNRIRGERGENLEKAIYHFNQALEVYTHENYPEQWAMTQNNLSIAYNNSIHGNRSENIERAIYHLQEALTERTRHTYPEQWATTQNNLGIAFAKRILGDWAENIEQAIHCFKQSLEVRTLEGYPLDWAITQNNLATAYKNRIRGERGENLEQAIYHFKQALKVLIRLAYPEQWATTQNNLAIVYTIRIRGERSNNIEQAIDHYNQALEVYTLDSYPEQWATTHNNLAVAYLSRDVGDRAENIEHAINHYQEALVVRTFQNYPEDWATTHNNLAAAFLIRLDGQKADNIEKAINHYHMALEVRSRESYPQDWATSQNNLGVAYIDRIDGDRQENLEHAIYYFRQVLEVRTPQANPIECRQTARNLGNLGFEMENWALAANGYREALTAQRILLRASFQRLGKEDELEQVKNISTRAAYSMAKMGELHQAIETLEAGRAWLLRERLEHNRRDLQRLPEIGVKSLYDEYQQAIQELGLLLQLTESRIPDWLSKVEKAQFVLDQAITNIQEVPGYENFFKALNFQEVAEVAKDAALIYLFTTQHGGLALIVFAGRVEALWIDVTEKELNEHLFEYKDGEITGGYIPGAMTKLLEQKSWLEASLSGLINWLGEKVMTPLGEWLSVRGVGRVVLIPMGILGLLPLHASWVKISGDRFVFMDRFSVAYAPSAQVLQAAIKAKNERVGTQTTLLAVGNPLPTQYELDFARVETEESSKSFERSFLLYGYEATSAAFFDLLPESTHIHLGCHGEFNPYKPLESRLQFANHETLTLDDVLNPTISSKMQKVRLVVLSACQTAVTDFDKLPDESIGFPSGFLQAGIPGVIGTLWSVNDLSTALIMTKFYEYYLKRNNGESLEPIKALRRAQTWLRDATAGELIFFTKNHMREKVALHGELYFMLYDSNEQPYKDKPHCWAPFVFIGV